MWRTFNIVLVPIVLLNALSGLAAIIWIGWVGEWRALFTGVVLIALAPLVLSLVMIPAVIFAGPAGMLAERGRNILALPFALLGTTYIHLVVLVWCSAVIIHFSKQTTADNVFPMALWTYEVALAPWAYFAQKEAQSGAHNSTITVLILQFALIGIFACLLFFNFTIAEGIMLLGAAMLLSVAALTTLAVYEMD